MRTISFLTIAFLSISGAYVWLRWIIEFIREILTEESNARFLNKLGREITQDKSHEKHHD